MVVSDSDVNGISFGGTFGYSNLAIDGAYGTGEEDEDDLEFWNIGIGGTYGPLGLSAETTGHPKVTTKPTRS